MTTLYQLIKDQNFETNWIFKDLAGTEMAYIIKMNFDNKFESFKIADINKTSFDQATNFTELLEGKMREVPFEVLMSKLFTAAAERKVDVPCLVEDHLGNIVSFIWSNIIYKGKVIVAESYAKDGLSFQTLIDDMETKMEAITKIDHDYKYAANDLTDVKVRMDKKKQVLEAEQAVRNHRIKKYDLTQTLISKEDEYDGLVVTKDLKNAELAFVAEEVAKLEVSVKEATIDRDRVKKEFYALEATKLQTAQLIEDTEDAITKLEDDKARIDGSIEILEKNIRTKEVQKANFVADLADKETRIANNEAEYKFQDNKLKTLKNEKQAALKSLNDKKAELADLYAQLRALEAKIEDQLALIDLLENQMSEKSDDVRLQEALAELAKLKELIAVKNTEIEKVSGDIINVESDIVDINGQIDDTTAKRDAAAVNLENLNAEREQLEMDSAKIAAELKTMSERLKVLESTRDNLEVTNEELRKTEAKHNETIKKLDSDIAELVVKDEAAAKTLADLEAALKLLLQNVAGVKAEKDAIETDIGKTNEEILTVKGIIAQKETKSADLQAHIDELKEDIIDLSGLVTIEDPVV